MAQSNWQEWLTVAGYLAFLLTITLAVLWPRNRDDP
jgi:hypothetical protein